MSRREQVLAALLLRLQSGLAATVRRNEALPEKVPAAGGSEAALDALLGAIGTALKVDPSLGGHAENLVPSAPETGALAFEGAAPVLTARLVVTVEYLVSDPLAA
jgi:hypothetical protein